MPSPRALLAAAWLVGLVPFLACADKDKSEVHLEGQVAALKDAKTPTLALHAADGQVYPLSRDDGARMFYTDDALLNRPMRLTGRLVGEARRLQVFQVHSRVRGEPHEVYYWCDVCAIKRFEKRDCECCGAAMERREEKVKR